MKATDYTDIGRYLKDVRESQRITIQQVAHDLHMRVHYVEALESGNLEILPGKAYVRGYIKNYASYLGMDPTEALAAYDALSVTLKQELYIPEPTISESLPSRTLLMVALAASILIIGYYMLLVRESKLVIARVADVPASLVFAAESIKKPQISEWMQCLNSNVNECFNVMLARDVLVAHELEYAETIRFLSGI